MTIINSGMLAHVFEQKIQICYSVMLTSEQPTGRKMCVDCSPQFAQSPPDFQRFECRDGMIMAQKTKEEYSAAIHSAAGKAL